MHRLNSPSQPSEIGNLVVGLVSRRNVEAPRSSAGPREDGERQGRHGDREHDGLHLVDVRKMDVESFNPV